ncbi:DUF1345 domain-containing protein [Mucilaginibacter boryungensis]|uniref:DUF1345 domain-containing protein n=1 Tax=Mucilaginibacter boryungensis TaxID=768480 RepID=A0ABR9XFA0_9SPHI|nr:DUF1345 domain-containing protein [Mucilaginibacter boryungensis]MBE9665891.1 DUF1345 domain-containing protein [Mucilaginibacter boryungensis]
MTKAPTRHALFTMDAHYRFYISLVVAVITFFFIRTSLSTIGVVLLTWSSFALSVIIMDWILIFTCHPKEVRNVARIEDSSRTLIFIFVIGAALVSLVSILFLLKSDKQLSQAQITGHVILSMISVVVSWWLVHTIFSMRYAHMFYSTNPDGAGKKPLGGLDFPGGEEPDYLDFVYFSFVLGTTFQVSDVEISSRRIRRLALIHGLIAFAFNTAILALSINVVSGLVSH